MQTVDELVSLLQEKGARFYVTGAGTIRCTLEGKCMCPLVAAAFHMTGDVFTNGGFVSAAARLGMDKYQAHRIAEAADNNYYDLVSDERKATRDKLLALVHSEHGGTSK